MPLSGFTSRLTVRQLDSVILSIIALILLYRAHVTLVPLAYQMGKHRPHTLHAARGLQIPLAGGAGAGVPMVTYVNE
jgi:hypothetical protein